MVLLRAALAMGVRDFAAAPQPSYSIVRGDVVCGPTPRHHLLDVQPLRFHLPSKTPAVRFSESGGGFG
jgi:hypothetical protein